MRKRGVGGCCCCPCGPCCKAPYGAKRVRVTVSGISDATVDQVVYFMPLSSPASLYGTFASLVLPGFNRVYNLGRVGNPASSNNPPNGEVTDRTTCVLRSRYTSTTFGIGTSGGGSFPPHAGYSWLELRGNRLFLSAGAMTLVGGYPRAWIGSWDLASWTLDPDGVTLVWDDVQPASPWPQGFPAIGNANTLDLLSVATVTLDDYSGEDRPVAEKPCCSWENLTGFVAKPLAVESWTATLSGVTGVDGVSANQTLTLVRLHEAWDDYVPPPTVAGPSGIGPEGNLPVGDHIQDTAILTLPESGCPTGMWQTYRWDQKFSDDVSGGRLTIRSDQFAAIYGTDPGDAATFQGDFRITSGTSDPNGDGWVRSVWSWDGSAWTASAIHLRAMDATSPYLGTADVSAAVLTVVPV